MPFPRILHCLVCEQIRRERNNLSSILGFYGITPDVDIIVQRLGAPLGRLSFLLICGEGGGHYRLAFRIISPTNETLIDAPPLDAEIRGNSPRYNLGLGINAIRFTAAGIYTMRLFTDNALVYETTFRVREALPGEIQPD